MEKSERTHKRSNLSIEAAGESERPSVVDFHSSVGMVPHASGWE